MTIGQKITCQACKGHGTVAGTLDAFTPDQCVVCKGRGYVWTPPNVRTDAPPGKKVERRG